MVMRRKEGVEETLGMEGVAVVFFLGTGEGRSVGERKRRWQGEMWYIFFGRKTYRLTSQGP